jgi:cytochrome bd-type quinol oxidase subunit 2
VAPAADLGRRVSARRAGSGAGDADRPAVDGGATATGRAGSTPSTASGPGRVLVAVYGVFALSASARAGVQLLRDWHEAPLAYALSAFAAVVYLLATVALARGRRRLAVAAVGTELVGVLVVGTLSVVDPQAFPEATVWSGFGSGYGYVPLVLPLLGLAWLARSRGRRATGEEA